eukprot:TRINITY_DN23908_c0_g2_i1.p1 TRINITY_DN23908_c0_g2~~TRINITY_DN23908_c0_g2_i1.p1  ORF type:complete len:1102 (+),score=146.28 TRINITY_DN23908_c0_g2_i1:147-3452(+)
MQVLLDKARDLQRERQYSEAVDVVIEACGFTAVVREDGDADATVQVWPPARLTPDTDINFNDTYVEQLMLLGVQCSIQHSKDLLYTGNDWSAALHHAARAVQLYEGSAVICDLWRSQLVWARVRLDCFFQAAEALRASVIPEHTEKAQACLERCRAVLSVSPKCASSATTVQVHVNLAETRWRTGDLSGARYFCEYVLKFAKPRLHRSQASHATPGKEGRADAVAYFTIQALWVLQGVEMQDKRREQSSAILLCAKYLVKLQRCQSNKSFWDQVKRLWKKMSCASEEFEKENGEMQNAVELGKGQTPDLQWLLDIRSGHTPLVVAKAKKQITQASCANAGQRQPQVGDLSARPGASTVSADCKIRRANDVQKKACRSASKGKSRSLTAASAACDASPSADMQEGGESEADGADEAVADSKQDKPTPVQISASGDIVIPRTEVSFCLLAVAVKASGHEFPVWRVAINSQNILREVLRRWGRSYVSLDHKAPLPASVTARTGPQGTPLKLDERLQSLRPLLHVRDGRLSITVSWPAESLPTYKRPRADTPSAGKLSKLRISTRYANVDGNTMGFHTSSTHRAKLEAGCYDATMGQYSQGAYLEAMRTPPDPETSDLVIASRELFVFDDSRGVRFDQEIFRCVLRGPAEAVANWEATCNKFEKSENWQDTRTPYPVFLPSLGRATTGTLNWQAEHVFGKEAPPAGQLAPVVVIVVEPREEEEYRDEWPLALTLVLPENKRGPGFVRWAIQRLCTRAYVKAPGQVADNGWQLRRLPYVWIADDGLSMFYRLVSLKQSEPAQTGGVRRLKEREAPVGAHMFAEAFLEVQRHSFLAQTAVAGFLRDDGTAVCKRREWKADELSMYKIVLLNLGMLRKLNVQYQRDLQMYEDICLTHEVIKKGGKTLKCQTFCFRASHSRRGGCSEQRGSRGVVGTLMEDLMVPAAFNRLDRLQQDVVKELLTWVRSKERMSEQKSSLTDGSSMAPKSSKSKSASSTEQRDLCSEKRKLSRDAKGECAVAKKRKLEDEKMAQTGETTRASNAAASETVALACHDGDAGSAKPAAKTAAEGGSSSSDESGGLASDFEIDADVGLAGVASRKADPLVLSC